MRSVLKWLLVLLPCTGLLLPQCGGESDPPKPSSVGERSPAAVESSPTEAVEAAEAVPRSAPAAYFGGLSVERLDGPMQFEPPDAPRSVVLIVMDALNARHLGIYGYGRDTSPTIDALAKEGVFSINHVSNSSWTRPSYTTIITGVPKSVHGVELGAKTLENALTTVAERFRTAGYKTAAMVGNPLVREIWGFAQGYQVYRDTQVYDKAFPWDGLLIDEAIEWLNTTGDSPFFLTLFLTSPHAPYRPPRKARRFLKTVPEGPFPEYPFREYNRPLPKEVHARIVAAYDDDIAYMDREIGQLISALKKGGRYENTAMLLTADHGEMMGQHNCYAHAYHMWEPTLRVPLIIHAPGVSPHDVYDDRPSTHVDLAPTLLDLAGIGGQREGLDGRSIFEPARAGTGDRIRYSQYNVHGIRRQAIRDDRYKVVHYHRIEEWVFGKLNAHRKGVPAANPRSLPSLVASLDGERYALFDLVEDPSESSDRFGELRQDPAVQRLLKALGDRIGEKDAPSGGLSKETLEALKNAGYFVPES